VEEELVTCSGELPAVNGDSGPAMQVFTDMEDILLLDPIHDVDYDAAGWPPPSRAGTLRDYAREVLAAADAVVPERTLTLAPALAPLTAEAPAAIEITAWEGAPCGREAVLVLPLAEPDDDPYTVTIDLVPFLTPTRPHMEVEVGDTRWGFSGTTLADARRTTRVHAGTRIVLRFKIHHPLSPLTARYDGDPRPLGIALRGLSLR
jgi:hypothetical protein